MNIPENNPIRRIYGTRNSRSLPSVTGKEATNPLGIDSGTRLLSDPIKRMEELQILLEIDGGGRFPPFVGHGHDLVFEILSLQPIESRPTWNRHTLLY